MEFRDTDTELDRKLKIRMLEIYNKRLEERIRRKEFIIDRGLLNVKRQQALERKRTPQERDIHGAVRVFARFLDPNEYEIMLEGFMAESRIRNRIAELKEYRRNGIHTLSEGEVYDAEKRHRMAEIARIKAIEYPGRGGSRANRYLGRDGFVQAPAGDAAPKELQKLTGIAAGGGGSGALTSLGGTARKKAPLPLDLTHLPGVELLSKREKELCVANRLLPVHYLSIKEALMRASANGQVLKRSEVRHMFKVEPIKAVRVFELLLQHGWVKDPNETEG
jgi:transcriptional adapter 2-alpha